MIGKLQRVPLREVWPHEARDFTTWLQDNLQELNEVLGISLASAEREQAAGDFSIDLIAEDEAGNPVIIENQLERSDHDHLGKVITYLAAIGANTAVWIVAEPRSEHIGAISWLNESSSGSFYLVKVEVIKIGESEPAPLLTLIVGPSEESREVAETKKELAERYSIRYRYWAALLETARERSRLHSNISPNQYNWLGASAGIRGLSFNYVIRMHGGHVELWIDRGRDTHDENKYILEVLMESRDEAETSFGENLVWDYEDGRRGCRIAYYIELGGYRDSDRWPKIHDAMIDAMIRLESALRPHIDQLNV